MQSLHFNIFISAPREKVRNTMLDDATYREWTSVFSEGSYYEGSREQGSKIKFLGPEGGGMFAEIAENRPYEFMSIRHLGEIGKEEEQLRENLYENYTLLDKDSGTELVIDLSQIPDEFLNMFNDLRPKALQRLKEIVENTQ